MERETRIPRSSGPIAVQDDQVADESSYSISACSTQGDLLSQTQRRPKPLQSGESVSAGDRYFGLGSY